MSIRCQLYAHHWREASVKNDDVECIDCGLVATVDDDEYPDEFRDDDAVDRESDPHGPDTNEEARGEK